MVEEEAAKRIEELVQKRVEEELEKRKEEIEAEVQRRVQEAKQAMERQMMAEMEWRQTKLREEEKRREVRSIHRNIGPIVAQALLRSTKNPFKFFLARIETWKTFCLLFLYYDFFSSKK